MQLKQVFSKRGRLKRFWEFDAKTRIVSSPMIADLIGDGGKQIIFGTKDGQVTCLDERGRVIWNFKPDEEIKGSDAFFYDQEKVHSVDAPPIVADITGDGKPNIIFSTEMGRVYCLSSAGKLLWTHDCGGAVRSAAYVNDINNDGKPEILVGSSNNKLSVLTGEGKLMFEYHTESPVSSVPGVLKGPEKNDILIIFGTDNGSLLAITPGQELVWNVDLGDKITAQPSFFSTTEEDRLVVGTMGGKLFCVSEHGEKVWEFKTLGSIYSKATVTDLDSDGSVEILFGSCDNNIYALTSAGKKLWSYETDFWIMASPIVADVDLDGQLEVVAGSFDHNMYYLDAKGTYVLDYVPGLSGIVNQAGHYSNVLTADPGEQTGKKIWQFRLDSIIVGTALLEKQKKKPLVIATTKSGKVTALFQSSE